MTSPTSPYAPPSPPPMVCHSCAAHQVHNPIDRDRIAWYCPHVSGGVWALWNPTKHAWRIVQGLPQDAHRRIMNDLEARALAISASWVSPDGTELPDPAAGASPDQADAAGEETGLTS